MSNSIYFIRDCRLQMQFFSEMYILHLPGTMLFIPNQTWPLREGLLVAACINRNTLEWLLYRRIPVHNEELDGLYCSPNIVRLIKSRRMRWAGHVARMSEKRSVWRVLVGIPERKRPLGRPRRRWEDNIKMDLQEVGCGYGLDRADSG